MKTKEKSPAYSTKSYHPFPTVDLKDMLESEPPGYTLLENESFAKGRWSIHYRLIFQHESHPGKFWQAQYSIGATEYQDERPFDNEGEFVRCLEVKPVQITKTIYVDVE